MPKLARQSAAFISGCLPALVALPIFKLGYLPISETPPSFYIFIGLFLFTLIVSCIVASKAFEPEALLLGYIIGCVPTIFFIAKWLASKSVVQTEGILYFVLLFPGVISYGIAKVVITVNSKDVRKLH